MKYLIVDDLEFNFSSVAPLRSQLEIRAGILKLRQKIEGHLGIEDVNLIIDGKLEEIYKERYTDKIINQLPDGDICFLNGRIKISEKIADIIIEQKLNSIIVNENGEFIAVKISNPKLTKCDSYEFLKMDFSELTKQIKDIELWKSLEEITLAIRDLIQEDYTDFFYDKDNYSETEQGVTIINPYNVWIGEGVTLKHGTVLDGSQGPIIIDEEAEIGLNTTIEGPAYIGKKCVVRASTLMRDGCSIGKNSVVGGEIVASIIQGFSTKPFKGTLNKCFVGEWTKFEAGISIDSDFFDSDRVTIIRDYSLSFLFSNTSNENICQYQEMRKTKLEAMKFDKKIKFSKIEQKLLKQYLNEEI